MKVKIPLNYVIKYPAKNQKYYNSPYDKEIRKKLLEASNGYCMYCGRKLVVDNEDWAILSRFLRKIIPISNRWLPDHWPLGERQVAVH